MLLKPLRRRNLPGSQIVQKDVIALENATKGLVVMHGCLYACFFSFEQEIAG